MATASRGSGLLQRLSLTASRQPMSAVRLSSPLYSPILSRCLSTTTSTRQQSVVPPFRLSHFYPQVQSRPWSVMQKRCVSYGSTGMLASLEQKANKAPSNFAAQNAFYTALLRANMPAVVIERIGTGRYAANQVTQNHYTTAQNQIGAMGGMSGMGSSLGNSQPSNNTLQSVAQAIAARANGGSAAMTAKMTDDPAQGSKKTPIYVVTEESWGQITFKWARMLLYFGLIVYALLVGIHFLIDTTGIIRRATGTQAVEATEQKARFADVQGCEEAKEELQELVEFLKDPTEFSTLGGKLPRGVLLTGPPGTGKTLLARAVAGESGVPFFYASGSEFDEMYVGVGAKRVRELFNQARSKSPAIIFIDELDAVGGKRSEKEASYHKQTLNQLLTELDGFNEDTGVIIIAATNFPESLDKALTRPGRFDRQVAVPLPDVRGRLALLQWYFKKTVIAEDVDPTALARLTTGMSGADIENLVNQAAVRASKNKQKIVSTLDLEWAFDKILMGPERKSAVIKEEDKLCTAYHEAGHALVGMFTKGCNKVYKATIMPRGHTLGVTWSLPDMDSVSVTKEQLKARMAMAMGGKIAEELIYGKMSTSTGCSSDLKNATSIGYSMVMDSGFSDKLGDMALDLRYVSQSTRAMIDSEVRGLVAEARAQAEKVLKEKEKELHLLAQALVKYELLDSAEIWKAIAGEDLSDKLKIGPKAEGDPTSGVLDKPSVSGDSSKPRKTPIRTPPTSAPAPEAAKKIEERKD